jgi:hypothetical protein
VRLFRIQEHRILTEWRKQTSFDKGNTVRSTSSIFMRKEPTSLEAQLYQLTGMEYLQECIWFDGISFVVYLVGKDFEEHRLQETVFT